MLAEHSTAPMQPCQEVNPDTLRVVSGIAASNGTRSMATTCGAVWCLWTPKS